MQNGYLVALFDSSLYIQAQRTRYNIDKTRKAISRTSRASPFYGSLRSRLRSKSSSSSSFAPPYLPSSPSPYVFVLPFPPYAILFDRASASIPLFNNIVVFF
ncbi:hypothetical protein EUGRSUZ_A01628 [Eucalyptus grandis]|uniref:Uncharacterized protein n=2 Tax=Eucalyptus grandis TaxID=71139 RepID=A0ACC3M2N0_EUCGR|nr:hypothetical protein EUGRSUZ_A01628 [Eucalyptus grandis]